jgi:hypothetical protein
MITPSAQGTKEAGFTAQNLIGRDDTSSMSQNDANGGTTNYAGQDAPPQSQSSTSGSSSTDFATNSPVTETATIFQVVSFLTSTTLQGFTTELSTSETQILVGTFVDGVATTTVSTIETVISRAVSTVVSAPATGTSLSPVGELDHFCAVANETIYNAGPCEFFAVAVGAM